MSRILKWPVPVDDRWHEIGRGPVALVQGSQIEAYVWTIEDEAANEAERGFFASADAVPKVRLARVVGTGHEFPPAADHLGSFVASPFVWHVIARTARKEAGQ